MAPVVFLQEDEDFPSVYRSLKIFCETAPRWRPEVTLDVQLILMILESHCITAVWMHFYSKICLS